MFDNIEMQLANTKLRIALLEHAQALAICADKAGDPVLVEQANLSYELAEKFK